MRMRTWGIYLGIFAALTFGSATKAAADAPTYTFTIQWISTTPDPANAGLFGQPDWYQWLYRLDVVDSANKGYALSHFTLELPDCFSKDLLDAIATTAGANGKGTNDDNLAGLEGNELRYYTISVGTDGSTGLWGIKWDNPTPNGLDQVGDYDYFWFSAPTNDSTFNTAFLKAASDKQGADVQTAIATPDCPEDINVNSTVPEPASMLLFGSGLLGAFIRRRKRA